jgi:hypothetical protein
MVKALEVIFVSFSFLSFGFEETGTYYLSELGIRYLHCKFSAARFLSVRPAIFAFSP